jgi:NAD(P)-dependent dehydrogenase (short-subunit alcohol dehydrogenase family)
MFDLHGKTAIITGAGSGIGAAIARVFGKSGAHVVIADRDLEGARAVAGQISTGGGAADALGCDVSDASSVESVVAAVRKNHPRIDILVNNAGIAHIGNVEQTAVADMERLFRVNVLGVFLCSKAVIPGMLEHGGGVILNMASIASLIGIADRFAYSMTKGAVLTMTKSIAIDYVRRGIRCNCICPARIHTPFVDGYLKANYPGREDEMFRKLSEYQPIGRMGKPDEVAHLALYLCSDEASFITGQAYPIDGGVLNE